MRYRNSLTASESYAAHRQAILDLMEHIRTGLDEHEPPPPVMDWGWVGDLAYVRKTLQEASDFLNREGEYE